jgi:hypothetical protein
VFEVMVSMVAAAGLGESQLQEEDCAWNEIEDATDVEATHDFVNDSRNFVEARSVTELDIRSFQVSFLASLLVNDFFSLRLWLVMDKFLELIVHHGFKVHVWYIHDDLKCDEMDDAMINSMLECQQNNVDALAE